MREAAVEPGIRHGCPPFVMLEKLVKGNLPDSSINVLAEHVGSCKHCQQQMESIASTGDSDISVVLKGIDKNSPPPDSAYWKAVGEVRQTITGIFRNELNGNHRDKDEGKTSPFGGSAEKHERPELSLDFLAPPDKPDSIGRLSTFDVERVIGRGGMGVVLQARDLQLERHIALKILDPLLANNEQARKRFCREARAAAAVSHDNVVAVHQVDEDDNSGLPFIVMQLVNGESLEQRLQRVGKLSVPEVIRLGIQAAAGLASAHAGGLIHRDIKPGNILIEAGTDKVKLTDFGLARAADDLKLTRSGFVAGTPLYMSPEQARGDDIDARADLFSLGTVLFEAVTGTPPFEGKSALAVLRRVADEEHPQVREINEEVPDWLEEIIDKLLEKNPDDRFQSALEVRDALSAHLSELQPAIVLNDPDSNCPLFVSTARSSSRVSRRKRLKKCIRPTLVMLSVFMAGVLTGGAGVWYAKPPKNHSDLASNILPLTPNGVGIPPQPDSNAGPKPYAVLPAGNGAVWSVAITEDGKRLAMGIESGRIGLWDLTVPAPKLEGMLLDHRGPVWAVEFTPDDEKLISTGDDAQIKVWDLSTRKPLSSWPAGTSLRSAAVNASGNWVAVGDRTGMVRVVDILEKEGPILEYQQDGVINDVGFCPDQLTVASVSSDSSVWIWEIAKNRKKFSLTGHNGPVYGLSFSHDGKRLATCGWDDSVIIWDLNSGTSERKLKAHDDGVWAVKYSRDDQYLATAGQDGLVKIWDAENGQLVVTFAGHKGVVHDIAFTKGDKMLASAGQDGRVLLWDLKPHLKSSGK